MQQPVNSVIAHNLADYAMHPPALRQLLEQHWTPLERRGVPPWSIRAQQQRQTLATRFAQRRHEILWHMSWFADAAQREQFKRGRDSVRLAHAGADRDVSDWSALGLADADLSELQQALVDDVTPWHEEQLSPRQQGALLAAIHQLQAQRLTQHAARWHRQIAALGAQRILHMGHNIYLAATDHQHGLCSALSAQVASAWMLERTGQVGHLERSLRRLDNAIAVPGSPDARILDLGLLEWAHIADSAKFGSFPARPLPDLDAVLRRVINAPDASAYQLSLGHHAVCLGVTQAGSQRRYFFADPNYGYVEFHSEEALRAGCAFQEQRWRRLFPGQMEDQAFVAGYRLRQYRNDLPTQPLFVRQTPISAQTSSNRMALHLLDLSQDAPLSRMFSADLAQDRSFRALQRRLTLAEYRTRMRPSKNCSSIASAMPRMCFTCSNTSAFGYASPAPSITVALTLNWTPYSWLPHYQTVAGCQVRHTRT